MAPERHAASINVQLVYLYARTKDFHRAAIAATRVAESGWGYSRQLTPAIVNQISSELTKAGENDLRLDLSLALVVVGFEDSDFPGLNDYFAMDLIADLIQRGRLDDATETLPLVASSANWFDMQLDRKFAPLWNEIDRQAGRRSEEARRRFRQKLDAAFNRNPSDIKVLRRYLRGLIALQAYEDILAKTPEYDNPERMIHKVGDEAVWITQYRAQAKIESGLPSDGDRLWLTLNKVDYPKRVELTNTIINHIGSLVDRKLNEQALSEITSVRDTLRASDYGWAWVYAAEVCALVDLHRMEEAKASLAAAAKRMPANILAHLKAQTCLGPSAQLDAVVIAVLDSDDRRPNLLYGLQPWPVPPESEQTAEGRGVRLLASRPEIRAKVESVGRFLPPDALPQ